MATERSYDEWRRLLAEEPLPAMLVDLDAFDSNVAAIAETVLGGAGDHTLRVASKSLRVRGLLQRVLDYGPPFAGVMCFTAPEAHFLFESGLDDLLVAYPTVRIPDLEALREIHRAGGRVTLVVDSLEGLGCLSRTMAEETQPFRAIVEVDCALRFLGGAIHLGVRRSPVRTVEATLELFRAARDLAGVQLVGLMAYEAQVAGLGDRNPWKRLLNPFAWLLRRLSARKISRLRRELAEKLSDRGFEVELFNGGGTGSLSWAREEPWLTELTAGSGFLQSHLFDYYSNYQGRPACFFALPVSRSSDPGYFTCLGGGYIASGEPGWDRLPIPWLPDGLSLTAMEGAGEVQTPLLVPAGVHLEPGDPVLFRHAKAGEVMERFDEVKLFRAGQLADTLPTYRGEGRCFL